MPEIKIIIKRLTFHSIKKRGFLAFNNFKSHITNDDLSYVLQYVIGSLGSHIQGEKCTFSPLQVERNGFHSQGENHYLRYKVIIFQLSTSSFLKKIYKPFDKNIQKMYWFCVLG